jgi:uncharacterized protein with PIN domain
MTEASGISDSASFLFHDELNDFLSGEKRNRRFLYHFKGKPSVKDAIEANHVPHTEVGCILLNDTPVSFTTHIFNRDRVEVFPVCHSVTAACNLKLRPEPEPDFIADVHLGKLTRLLRMLGCDVFYDRYYDDMQIIRRALRENRIILTRDRRLLHKKEIVHGCCLHSQDSREQLGEVVKRYGLTGKSHPFSRCMSCNGILHTVHKEKIADRLEPKTKRYFNRFSECDRCGKVYWQGSHFLQLQDILQHTHESM